MQDEKDKKDEMMHDSEETDKGSSRKIVSSAEKKIEEAKNSIGKLKEKLQQVIPQVVQPKPPASGWQRVSKPKFEIELYEEDTDPDTGDVIGYKRVPSEHPIYIEAASKQDMIEHARRYQLCHQRMKVIRQVPSEADVAKRQEMQQQKRTQAQEQVQDQDRRSSEDHIEMQKKSKPRYFKLGDIEVKEDNGKLYQKQWIKLSQSEANNLRLINEKNNSLVNIAGKHFEMKKWVQIENTEADESSNLEEQLNG